MAATMKLTITFFLLVSALVVFGDAKKAPCAVVCVQGVHITCDNYPGQKLDGCACECAPKDGKGCVLHLNSGSTNQCTTTPEY